MKVFEKIKQKFEGIKESSQKLPVKKIFIISALVLMIITTVIITGIAASESTDPTGDNATPSTPGDDVSVFNPLPDDTGSGVQGGANEDEPVIHTDERGLEFISLGNGTCYVNGFGSCQLAEIKIPAKSPAGDTVVKISSKAFSGSDKLLTISIPSTVKTIETGAFRGCSNLVSIEVDTDNSVYCSVSGVLFSKDKTTLVSYPINRASTSYMLPSDVRSIGAYAFEGVRNLKKLLYKENISSFQKINVLLGNEILNDMTITCNYVPAK